MRIPHYPPPETLDEAVRDLLERAIGPANVHPTLVDVGVAVMSNYIRNKFANDVLRYNLIGYDLKKLCAQICDTRDK